MSLTHRQKGKSHREIFHSTADLTEGSDTVIMRLCKKQSKYSYSSKHTVKTKTLLILNFLI